jgi:hypothetical protein
MMIDKDVAGLAVIGLCLPRPGTGTLPSTETWGFEIGGLRVLSTTSFFH